MLATMFFQRLKLGEAGFLSGARFPEAPLLTAFPVGFRDSRLNESRTDPGFVVLVCVCVRACACE